MEKHLVRLLGFLVISVLLASCANKKDIVETEQPAVVEQGAAGLISMSSPFVFWDQEVTLRFDLSKGNAALKGSSSDLYLHAGLIPETGGSWQKVVTDWNKNDNTYKLSFVSPGLYTFTFTPSKFFQVSDAASFGQIALLVRNGDGSLVQRNRDGSDLFVPLVNGKEGIRFVSPITQPTDPILAEQQYIVGEAVKLKVQGTHVGKISLWDNGVKLAESNSALSVEKTFVLETDGLHQMEAKLEINGKSVGTTMQLFAQKKPAIAALPVGINRNGVTIDRTEEQVSFVLTAPLKKSVYLLGDFNQYKASPAYAMSQTPDGKSWWITLSSLDFSKNYTYQFLVDGQLLVADPYAGLILDPQYDPDMGFKPVNLPTYPQGARGIVAVLDLTSASYPWKVNVFNKPNPGDLVIYELLVRDFVKGHQYTTLRDSISYLKRLGVNAVELMPIQESEGNSTWGYNPSFHRALDKYYGSKNELKAYIDACHENGIAVILDVVFNHAFGQSPMVQLYFENGQVAANSPWFNTIARHPFNVGYDFNHESLFTQAFVKDMLAYWLQEYRVDGFRFDLSKGFTQKNSGIAESDLSTWNAYDASRIAILKQYQQHIHAIDPTSYVILEHLGGDQEEKELAQSGMLLWNNMNTVFNEAAMGWHANNGSDLGRLFASGHGMTSPAFVSYMESHDEQRLLFKCLNYGNAAGVYSIKNLGTGLERMALSALFLLASPGPKMIWQFGEYGYDVSIDENGRTGEKPIRWDYLQQEKRQALFGVYADLIHFKTNNRIFRNGSVAEASVKDAMKYYLVEGDGQQVAVLGNFGVEDLDFILPNALRAIWKDNFTGNTLDWSQQTRVRFGAGEYLLLSKTKLNK
ncbi:1,4-alpha-glucan-branching protein [Sphingobacterium sp. InxBP1]|uniref:alpha-amylase family glycosyl hydrolase n=1 Tax=Sphingobacterium sp. InxBP1 TaxID=2870328 RepID=UPI002242F19E|nr:alpha-amylase family glycosyl hydrolase [Sphingobacterium sp. InxBP1]MCW8310081.1 1,4-alpha-glucan-branching protein [Sphingobacterium sp. InxBP1]